MDRKQFFDMFSGAAKEQQKRYGIPASVTLAQMLLESGGGSSKLAREGNNFFGIKQHGWKGAVVYENDDKKHEAFRKYDKVSDSIEDHSKFLMQKRYAKCRELSPTDYEGWCRGLKAAGYATDPKYAESLINIIKCNKLDRYDLEAQMEAEQAGVKCGENRLAYLRQSMLQAASDGRQATSLGTAVGGGFGMPLRDSVTMLLTSDFGYRNISFGTKGHEGIDLQASKGTDVYASETGIVLTTGYEEGRNGKAGGGNYMYVAYPRPDGTFRVAGYLHLDSINKKAGDLVTANSIIAKSGNSGNVGAHLDFRVAKVDKAEDIQTLKAYIDTLQQTGEGKWSQVKKAVKGDNVGDKKYGHFIDPKQYLAEIAEAGQLDSKLIDGKTKQDVLADARQKVNKDDVALLSQQGAVEDAAEDHELLDHDISGSLSQMASLFGDENSQNSGLAGLLGKMGTGGIDIIGGLFSLAVMAYLSAAKGKSKEEKQAAIASLAREIKGENQDNEATYTVDQTGHTKNSDDTQALKEKAKTSFDLEYDRMENAQNQEQRQGLGV